VIEIGVLFGHSAILVPRVFLDTRFFVVTISSSCRFVIHCFFFFTILSKGKRRCPGSPLIPVRNDNLFLLRPRWSFGEAQIKSYPMDDQDDSAACSRIRQNSGLATEVCFVFSPNRERGSIPR
jgi:hypothetical protein